MAIELKTDEGILDKLQEYNLEQIAQCGGIAVVMTPANFEKIFTFLLDVANEAEKYYKSITIIQ